MTITKDDIFPMVYKSGIRMNEMDDLVFGLVDGDIHEVVEQLIEDPVYDRVWKWVFDHVVFHTRDLIYD